MRIEPGEIEAALMSHAAVDDAVVLGVAVDGGLHLSGHVLSAVNVEETALRHHLLERLPPLMVPTSLLIHAAFPMTTSGKVDRSGLRKMATEDGGVVPAQSLDREPTPTELRLSQLWESVMSRSSPRLDDDFFAIGGHSLLGVRLISHAADEFGVALPLRMIYEAPTVAGMAAWIDRELQGSVAGDGRVS
ncbi:MAG: phosphopantetheine-binding protein [Acidimicrobiia bacterium]